VIQIAYSFLISVRQHLRSWYALEADISSMQSTTRLTIFETMTSGCVCGYSMIDGSICHFKFPNVVVLIHFRRSGHFLHNFDKCLLQNMHINFYLNRFIHLLLNRTQCTKINKHTDTNDSNDYIWQTQNENFARFLRHGVLE